MTAVDEYYFVMTAGHQIVYCDDCSSSIVCCDDCRSSYLKNIIIYDKK